jgi:hypothetical protein
MMKDEGKKKENLKLGKKRLARAKLPSEAWN